MWEILTDKIPYGEMQVLQIVRAIDLGKRPAIPEDCDQDYKKIIEDCWNEDTQTRPHFDAIYVSLAYIYQNLCEKEEFANEVKQTVEDWFGDKVDEKKSDKVPRKNTSTSSDEK